MSPLTRQFIIIFFLTCYTSDIGMGYWHTLTSKLKGLFSLGGRFKCSQLRLCRVLGRSKQSSYKEFWFGFPLFLWSLKHGAAIKFSVYGPFCIRGFTEASYPIYRCCIHGCFLLLMQPARLMLFVATQDGKLGSERDIQLSGSSQTGLLHVSRHLQISLEVRQFIRFPKVLSSCYFVKPKL